MPTGPSSGYGGPSRMPNSSPGGCLKPGYKTTEWWITLGSFLVCGFVLTGVVSQDNQNTIAQIVTHAITSVGLVAGQVAIAYKYISGRNQRKLEVLKQEKEKPVVKKPIAKKKKRPGVKNERTKRSSKKTN